MRDPLRAGASAFLLLVIMLGGGLVLWIGVPLLWLWIGSQVQFATGSLGAALAAMFLGVPASILALVKGLRWLDLKHRQLRQARGYEAAGEGALEMVMTVSAIVAVIGFTVWFLVLAGPGPTLAPQI